MSLNGEMLEEVDHFKYLGLQIGREGVLKVGVSFRVGGSQEGCRHSKKVVEEWGFGSGG